MNYYSFVRPHKYWFFIISCASILPFHPKPRSQLSSFSDVGTRQKCDVFVSPHIYEHFSKLSAYRPETGVLKTPYGELTRAMHYIGKTYGSFLRRQKGWIWHVFAGIYKSLCADKEGYLLELNRYIHLNPVIYKNSTVPVCFLFPYLACERFHPFCFYRNGAV